MITAVTFDVWETLITDPPELAETRSLVRVRLMNEALLKAGLQIPEARLLLAYQQSWQEYERFWDNSIDISTAEQLEILLNLVDPTLLSKLDVSTLEDVTGAYVNPVFDYPPPAQAGLLEVLKHLKMQGRKLGLICNTGRTPGWAVRQLLNSYEALSYFDALAFSNEERIRKPAGEIFLRVLASLGVAPENAVHIGDNIVTDIGGAKGLGMKAILIGQSVPGGSSVLPDASIVSLSELPSVLARIGEP